MQENKNKPDLVDFDKIFKTRTPLLYKFLPRFVIRYIERFLYQDGVNEIITRYQNDYGLEFTEKILSDYFDINLVVEGKENLPETGRFIFVSNHPLGGLDGLANIATIGKIFGDVKHIVNDLLMNLRNLDPVFFPANVFGRQTKQLIADMNKLYASDYQVITFPAGMVSRRINGKIQDLEWKKSFVAKSIQYRRDVVPMYFAGKNSSLFYNVAHWRKKLKIKINLEMLLLPREVWKQKSKTIRIFIGKPIPYSTFDKSRTRAEWATLVREKVYNLDKQNI